MSGKAAQLHSEIAAGKYAAAQTLPALLARYQRIAITGAPKAGKTTLVQQVTDRPVVHGDDHMGEGWSGSSERLAAVVNAIVGPVVVEGVQVPRALRKGMRVDCVVWLEGAHQPLSGQQNGMAKGVRTVLNEWRALNPDVPVITHWASAPWAAA